MCMPDESSRSGSDTAEPTPSGEHSGMSNVEMFDLMTSPDSCGSGSHFLFGMSMCLPMPRKAGAGTVMAMGNLFVADIGEQGPRGRRAVSAPNWIMLDGGVDLASWNRLELDTMLTAELWTTPSDGYPQLLQIGENQADGQPFLDAQHPHSSPLMGLTLTDEFSFDSTSIELLRLFFAPRGESTDGPIAFMHRPTGMWNPDAPLGHHIGQDVGHVTSTVIGTSFQFGGSTLEASLFHGLEPQPTQVDLPLGVPDSFAVRLSHQFGPGVLAAVSFAEVTNPEGTPTIPRDYRFSASVYAQQTLNSNWRAHAALIWGGIAGYDNARFLNSFDSEAVVDDGDNGFWGRIEVLQRTGAELEIVTTDPNIGAWVVVPTVGYSRKIVSVGPFDFFVGGSISVNFLPAEFSAAYGGPAPISGKVFLEARGIHMWSFGPD
jgi:hypothetical protein